MPPKSSFSHQGRRPRHDSEFITTNRSLRRGKRRTPRTQVCRPCLFWPEGAEEDKRQGVVLDLNPYGMRLRSLATVPVGTEFLVQMMRDEDFQVPLSPPILVNVVRTAQDEAGFVDHGLKVILKSIKRPEEINPVHISQPRVVRRVPTRMHIVDHLLRMGRRRG